MRNITIIACVAFVFSYSAHGQDLLMDDVSTYYGMGNWLAIIDSLEFYGITMHYVSDEGWSNIMDRDVVWILPRLTYYSPETISVIQEFVHNGGRVVNWNATEHVSFCNDLHTAPGWQTTMEVFDIGIHYPETIRCISPFPPFTDSVDSLRLQSPYIISCGENAYPFAFVDSNCSQAVAAISYPFLHENNCNSFIVLVTGADALIYWPCIGTIADNLRFELNILYSAAGVPGYELEPGAIPGGGNVCEEIPEEYNCFRAPNPFTPNGDEINDYCQFEFDGMGNSEGRICIYDMHALEVKSIAVPEGTNAKTKARWYGKDNDGNPLPQGLYIFTIESDGETVCEGTITIAR